MGGQEERRMRVLAIARTLLAYARWFCDPALIWPGYFAAVSDSVNLETEAIAAGS